MATVRNATIDALRSSGIHNATREADWLLESVTGIPFPQELNDEEVASVGELVARRVRGEPIQYLTGIAGFRTIELAVGPGVFIPRPETEITAAIAMGKLPDEGILVEIGTGSGAIALAVAIERPDARVIATERSPIALGWADRNRTAIAPRVTLLEGDLFQPLPAELKDSVDVVVSNPPYIAETDAHVLAPDVVEYEPHEALFAGADGSSVLRELADQAMVWLRLGGWLVTEIGEKQGTDVSVLFKDAGYEDVMVHPDLNDRDRVVVGRRSG